MAAVDVQSPVPDQQTEPATTPALPDYVTNPNAVLGDAKAVWRYGRAPDYSKTRKVWAETKKMNHVAGSLPQLVENLVKNWEVEASFKTKLSDWRTVDPEKYSFAINGGPPQTGEHMLKVGTYNAIIAPNEYYSPEHSDFASSHKTFKRMMPTFAWEVMEVYSGPPKVSFRWRHWGTMKNDYVGFNDKGEKVVAKAHGGLIDITGVTVATVDDKLRLQDVDTYFDPLEMFRQIAPQGIINREAVDVRVDRSAAMDMKPSHDGVKIGEEFNNGTIPQPEAAVVHQDTPSQAEPQSAKVSASEVNNNSTDDPTSELMATSANEVTDTSTATANSDSSIPMSIQQNDISITPNDAKDMVSITQQQSDGVTHGETNEHTGKHAVDTQREDMDKLVQPHAGEAVVSPPSAHETYMTHLEMSKISPAECPFLMNKE